MGAQEVPRGSSGRQSPSGTLFHRPRGARNKVAKRFFEDMAQVWDEPTPDGKSTRGLAALRLMWREEPAAFAKLYAGRDGPVFRVEYRPDEGVKLLVRVVQSYRVR